jgi:hypothetical protein
MYIAGCISYMLLIVPVNRIAECLRTDCNILGDKKIFYTILVKFEDNSVQEMSTKICWAMSVWHQYRYVHANQKVTKKISQSHDCAKDFESVAQTNDNTV